ncbi:3-hydroxyisobutyrate dehydrogenase [Microbacterium ginsengiterrae]|uniref:3-hydroxyisobutyrate dehydrogenase n=1 Tax=Microbacterium ginsengiterrae TaxID=546115 RepID=A0A7W9CC69_9MICO|nr:3-hydroxyisobutyrate dehydrogenase [Microbacterium ginsengiterrae]
MTEAPALSLVGLGNMGAAMAARWVDGGVAVHGFDVSEGARAALEQTGGTAYPTAADAARASTVCVLMLPDSRIVDAVLADLLAQDALAPGALVIDMSSSEPMSSRVNADRLADVGVDFIDAPVSGGVRGVVAGTLAIMAGGDDRLVGRAKPILEHLGSVTHVGPVGAGHAAKALNNLVSASHLWMTSEAVLVAERFGIEPSTMVEVLNASTGRSVSSEVKWPKFILNEAYDSGFFARLLSKDASVATGLAAELGLPPLMGVQVAELWREAVAEMEPSADHTAIAQWIRGRLDAEGERR